MNLRIRRLIILLSSCLASSVYAKQKPHVILPESAKLYLSHDDGHWTPKEKDIQNLSRTMDQCLLAKKLKPERYSRQYAGFKKKNKKYLYVNLLCDSADLAGWKDELIVVEGDNCSVQMQIEVKTQECSCC